MSLLQLPIPPIALPVGALTLTVTALLALIERRRPAWRRPENGGWWARALLFALLQAVVASAAVLAWQQVSALSASYWPGSDWSEHFWLSVVAGYLLVTLVFYGWHRLRHAVPLLWRGLHQLHHSPTRQEVLSSYYRHPLEMIANAALVGAVLQPLLGLSLVACSVVIWLLVLAELFAHSNLRTPRQLGWLVKRPEMHRLHHARGLHHYNYSVLPLWDLLFGTLRNPQVDVPLCGFPEESRVMRLLFGGRVQEVQHDVSR